MKINKKGMEAEVLVKWLLALMILITIIAVIGLLKGSSENIFVKMMEKLRFG